MNGRCLCQPGITGLKCNICPNGERVGSQGCVGWYHSNRTHAAHARVQVLNAVNEINVEICVLDNGLQRWIAVNI
jgi:hypothetical protein